MLSVSEQCRILNLARSSYYYEPVEESEENLLLMRRMDELHTKRPFLGSRQLVDALIREGFAVNRKRIQRLMRLMGLDTIYCKPRTSTPNLEHRIYPYLLRGVPINRVNQVWSIDITYIRMRSGFLYLVAVIDWFSRYVLAWELSNSMTVDFCIEGLEAALKFGNPEVFNSDQGAQFTSTDFVNVLLSRDIKVSMDGKGRALDNVFIERLWRTVKYEEVYLNDYAGGREAKLGLSKYLGYYNNERSHRALFGATPAEVFMGKRILQLT